MSSDFNISNSKVNMEGLKAYFKSSNVDISAEDESKINTIFAECDTQNANGEKGADGILSGIERSTFLAKIKSALPKLFQSISDFINKINYNEAQANMRNFKTNVNTFDMSQQYKPEPKYTELSEATTQKTFKKGSLVLRMPQEKTKAELKQLIKNCDMNDNEKVAETVTILNNSFASGDEELGKWIQKLFGKNLKSIEQPNRDNNMEYHLTDGRVITCKNNGYIEIANPDSTVDRFKPHE